MDYGLNSNLSGKASKGWTLAGVADANTVTIPADVSEILLEYIGSKAGIIYHTSGILPKDTYTRYPNMTTYAGNPAVFASATITNRVVTFTRFQVDGTDVTSKALFVYYR